MRALRNTPIYEKWTVVGQDDVRSSRAQDVKIGGCYEQRRQGHFLSCAERLRFATFGEVSI